MSEDKKPMTLDEAIEHAKKKSCELYDEGCVDCAAEHRQLANWLHELKVLREENTTLKRDLGRFL